MATSSTIQEQGNNEIHPILRELNLPTSEPLRPRIYEKYGSLETIIQALRNKESEVHVSAFLSSKYGEYMDVIDTSLRKSGMVFVTKSLPMLMNIESPKNLPANILFDICLLTCGQPVTFLTVSSDATDNIAEYNWFVANKLLHALRRYSDEMITTAYGIVHEKKLKNRNSLKKTVEDIVKESTRFANPLFLTMSESKLVKVYKSLISAMAIEKRVEFHHERAELSEELHVLPPPIFSAVLKYIDVPRVKVNGSIQHTRNLMIEVARRLEKNGKTILIFRTDDMKNLVSRLNICSAVEHQDERTISLNSVPKNIRHIVAEVENLTDAKNLEFKEHLWLFVTGTPMDIEFSQRNDQAVPNASENNFIIDELKSSDI